MTKFYITKNQMVARVTEEDIVDLEEIPTPVALLNWAYRFSQERLMCNTEIMDFVFVVMKQKGWLDCDQPEHISSIIGRVMEGVYDGGQHEGL